MSGIEAHLSAHALPKNCVRMIEWTMCVWCFMLRIEKVKEHWRIAHTPYKTRQQNQFAVDSVSPIRLGYLMYRNWWIESQTIRSKKKDDDKNFRRIKREKRATSICQNQLKFNFLSHFFLMHWMSVCDVRVLAATKQAVRMKIRQKSPTFQPTLTHTLVLVSLVSSIRFVLLLLLFWQLILLSAFFGVFIRFCNGTKPINGNWFKRISFGWTNPQKRRSDLPGWVPMETILTVRLSDHWEAHVCVCVSFSLISIVFFNKRPLSKTISIRQFNLIEKLTASWHV